MNRRVRSEIEMTAKKSISQALIIAMCANSYPAFAKAGGSGVGGGGLQSSSVKTWGSLPVGAQVESIDLSLLVQAKNLATQNTDVIHAILDVEAEYQRVQDHKAKEKRVREIIRQAIQSAAEGRFESGKFLSEKLTSKIVDEAKQIDEFITQKQLKRFDTEMEHLNALLARATVRSGQQAVMRFHVKITREFVESTSKDIKFLSVKVGSKPESSVRTDVVQTEVYIPETLSGPAYYEDEGDRVTYKDPLPKFQTISSLQNHALALIQPYSNDNKRGVQVGFNDVVVNNVLHAPEAALDSLTYIFGKAGNHSDVANRAESKMGARKQDPILFSQWHKANALNIKDSSITYLGMEYRDLLPKDREVWGNAIRDRLIRANGVLQEMWAGSENGYRFRMNSSAYDKFLELGRSYEASLRQMELSSSSLVAKEAIAGLKLQFPKIAEGRPRTLEDAVRIAIAASNAQFGPDSTVSQLINESLTFGVDTGTSQSTLALEGIAQAPSSIVATEVRKLKSPDLVEGLVDLYMNGKETVVNDIFIKMCEDAKSKFQKAAQSLTKGKDEVLSVINNPDKGKPAAQVKVLNEIKKILDGARAKSLTPDLLLTTEEFHSALQSGKITSNVKKIYKERDTVEHTQQQLRMALANAREQLSVPVTDYRKTPTSEGRTALLEFVRYYSNFVSTMQAEPWYYRLWGEPHFLGWDKDDNGKKMPITRQDYTIESLPLFPTEANKAAAQVTNVISPDVIEYIYYNNYFEMLSNALNEYARALGIETLKFMEYPSYTMSVSLKQHLDTFRNLRRLTLDKISGINVDSAVVDTERLLELQNRYRAQITGIDWMSESGKEGFKESDVLRKIEEARPRYNDLAQ